MAIITRCGSEVRNTVAPAKGVMRRVSYIVCLAGKGSADNRRITCPKSKDQYTLSMNCFVEVR